MNSIGELNIKSGSIVLNNRTDIFQRYTKEKQIGQGSYGTVFTVTQKITNKQFALKVVNKRASKDNYIQEVENVRRLNHPNILRVYEVSEDEQHIYIINELHEGQQLLDEIYARIAQSKPFSEAEVAIIARQILSAVAYAHDNKIIHRDIKPENILIDSQELHVLVIDWGLSKDLSELRSLRQRIGTVDYASPEVLKGEQYDFKTDVWSCGVIIYILLSGETPFPGSSTREIEGRIIKGCFSMDQKVWKKISPEAQDMVKKMIQYNPKDRISAVEALNHQWLKQQLKQSEPLNEELKLKLSQFNCKSKLVQATAQFMASISTTKSQLAQQRKLFTALDTNSDGKLSLEELMNGMKGQQGVQEIFERIDSDKSGFIDYTEFLSAVADFNFLQQVGSIKEAFDLFDSDGNGYIETEELKKILVTNQSQDEDFKIIIKELDENGDGKISYEEFKNTLLQFSQQNQYEPSPRKQVMTQSQYNLRRRQK